MIDTTQPKQEPAFGEKLYDIEGPVALTEQMEAMIAALDAKNA